MKRLLVVLTVFSLISANAQTDSAQIRTLANEILMNSQAYENLRVLTKTIGGRLAGSQQMYQAEEWGFKAL